VPYWRKKLTSNLDNSTALGRFSQGQCRVSVGCIVFVFNYLSVVLWPFSYRGPSGAMGR
jgi:hypothetical protein